MKGSAMEQHAERNNAKKHRNIPLRLAAGSLRLAAGLLCVMLGSSCYLSGIMARYSTTATSSDTARVAKFLITEDIERQGFSGEVDSAGLTGAAGPQTIALLGVTNDSEVAVKYTIKVEKITGNLPVEISLLETSTSGNSSEDSKFKIESIESPSESGSKGLTATIDLPPGSSNRTCQLNLEWKLGADENALDYMGMVDYISITAEAVQID